MAVTACKLMRPEQSNSELVDFLNSKTKGEKLEMISNMFENVRNLANALDRTRPDIANALDAILDGKSVSTKNMVPRFLRTIAMGNVWTIDSASGTFSRTTLKNPKLLFDIDSKDPKMWGKL